MIFDSEAGRRRVVHALIFTTVYSRHMFVWLTFTQTLESIIAGREAAWRFFGGVFKVLIPDNMKPIVAKADATNPRFTVGWLEYAHIPRLYHRPHQGRVAPGQATRGAGSAVRARKLLRRITGQATSGVVLM